MKKIIALLLALILCAMMFAGCKKEVEPSADGEEITDNTPDETPDETPETPADTGAETVPADPEDPAFIVEDGDGESKEITSDEKFETAFALIDHPVDELYAALGEPDDSSYASSCIGPGQDGELYYDDFIVCTYAENGVETVTDVYK